VKGLCLAGPPRSGGTSRPDSRDPVASGVKCRPHGGKKSKTKSSIGARQPVQGSGSQPESARGVCSSSPKNRRVSWLSHKTKTGGSTGGDGIRACREATMPADTWRDRRTCVRRTRSAATAWPCDEEECYMTYLPLRGCITTEVLGVVWYFACPGGDSYILALGFPGKLSIRTASHFFAL
jgi:hypothetical protein